MSKKREKLRSQQKEKQFVHCLSWINTSLLDSLFGYSAQEFCSVGDDSCLILWDARAGSSPAVKVTFICFTEALSD